MKRKITFTVIICTLIILLSYKYYYVNYSDQGILEKVINKKGYSLNQVQEPISIKLFIRPEWIPFTPDQKLLLNEQLAKIHSTDIILDNIWNRGNDIYFSFRTTYELAYQGGELLYNGVFNEDGSFSWSSRIDGIILYDENGTRISVGQKGSGPESDFSFGIEPEDYEIIKNGFYVEYNDFVLYQYALK